MKGQSAWMRLLRAWAAVVAMAFPATLHAVQATLTADAHVSQQQPDVNAGQLSNLAVGGGYIAMVRFDLGVLPSGTSAAQVSRATMRLYCNRLDQAGAIGVQPIYGAWTESGVTYNTLPVLGTTLTSTAVNTAGAFVTFDVTAQVQGWLNAPGSNYGLALSSATAVAQFDSKENEQTAHLPQLEIVLAAGSSAAVGTGANGATGATGATGVTGAIGAIGATGPAGVAGVAGATGATGATGAAGAGLVNYRGNYSSTTNYASGDVVVFSGSAYISQIASNHGSTPGLSPNWGLLAGVGATGSTGAVGATGVTGQQGPPGYGIQGATGATGVAGATGATGTAGLVYQGAYSSTTNYAQGDVVLWMGSSYASLMAGNHGNTPGMVPGTWGALTAQGPVGATGATGVAGAMGVTGALGPVGPPGERGDQGAQGIAGQAGAQGIPGTTGATGLQGMLGATGPAGPVGMSWQGAYNSTTNYSLGQAVLWRGAGYVSLSDNNHGNTPDASPSAWSLFAASGSSGATGATGYGIAGNTGATGATGINGLNGATGATGLAGTPGLVYQGAYSSTTNYALGDVVVWEGSSYASRTAGNRGQTPDASPSAWGILTSVGPAGPMGAVGPVGATGTTGGVGPQGSAGPQGSQGATGPMGPVGAQGLPGMTGSAGAPGVTGATGAAGPAGAQGIAGATGATGSQGLIGPTGAAGAVGMSFQGTYSSTTNYSQGQGVMWQGSGWVSLGDNNRGNTPDASPSQWAIFAMVGSTGATGATGYGAAGATGATGAAGAVGATGFAGATGATGAVGVHFAGSYSSSNSYAVGDAITYNGSSYLSLVANNHGQAPDSSPSNWSLLAAAGSAGAGGAAGATGVTGAAGVAGPQGAAGATGTTGAQGAQGAVGMNFRGAWSSSTRYNTSDAVTFAGSSYLALAANQNQEPDQSASTWAVLAEAGGVGPQGVAGATGSAATVSVGTVTTLAPGAQATVSNSGTNTAAVLNFGIPQGQAGTGGNGTSSAPVQGAYYHAVSYSTPYLAINSTSSNANETPAILAWMPQACTASRLDVYSQQSGTIRVTLRTGTASSLASSSLACTANPNGTCTVSGSVSIAAGQFVDLLVQNASGTTAPVWTALQCTP